MKKNMGTTDKMIRTIIALILGVLTYTGVISGTFAYVALALAIVFVFTSFISFCPLYFPFGINTCKKS
jgi:uncharacterized membrane protein YtjA (UPF0391 family)